VERRAVERIPISLNLTCRIPASPCRAIIHDISHRGCKVELPGGPVELGGTALMELPTAARVMGRVVWVKGRTAGIRFERSLDKATAIALGLEEAEPAEPVREPAIAYDNGKGLLHHWFRRLAGIFG
jgi:PilZ domain-containing protein